MNAQPRWGIGSNQYKKRPRPVRRVSDTPPLTAESHREQHELCGITWDIRAIDLDQIDGNGDMERARHRFRHRFPEMIWDAARLEGNTYTLPEVRTLLEGVTVEGRPLHDQQQILALNEAFNEIDQLVGLGEFALDKNASDRVHSLVAVHEAIEAGSFRGQGDVTGGGNVRLSHGGVAPGRDHGPDGTYLLDAHRNLLDYVSTEGDPRVRALVYSASAIRHQFYFDGNKRTAKLMASGELLSHGFDAVSIPYERLHEQNRALDTLFSTDDATDLMRLFADCARG